MAVKAAQNTFENIERLAHKAAQPVKQLAADVSGDIKESMGLASAKQTDNAAVEKLQSIPTKQKQQIKQADKSKISQIQQNIALINQQMMEVRKKREQKQDQDKKQEQRQGAVKQVEKQKKESMWQKIVKSRKGTKEGLPSDIA